MEVIQQPDGKYAIWDSSVDDFIVYDATADDIDTYIVTQAIEEAQQRAASLVAQAYIRQGSNPDLFENKIRDRNTIHGQPDEDDFKQWVITMCQQIQEQKGR